MSNDSRSSNIALTGAMRSGKSSVAEYLARQYGYTLFAFGDELKDDFHRRYPEIPRDPKPRLGYQSHGQLMRKLVDEDIWVRKAFDKIAEYNAWEAPRLRKWVCGDLRQPNEYARCRAEGFVIIRVMSSSALRIARTYAAGDAFNPEDLTHETESHVGTFDADYEIVNDGTINELYAQVDRIMRELGVGWAVR